MEIDVQDFEIEGPRLISPHVHRDARGSFFEVYRWDTITDILGLSAPFAQINQSVSLKRSTLRGLHAQRPPHAQGKLIEVLRGGIVYYAVDARKASPSYGQSIRVNLTTSIPQLFWVPAGFLSGFVTRGEHTVVRYQCTATYAPEAEITVAWDDPSLNLDWRTADPVLSSKDASGISFADFDSPF